MSVAVGNTPTPGQGAPVSRRGVVDPQLKAAPQAEEERTDRAEDPANRRHQGIDGLFHRIEAAPGQTRFGDLLGRNAEEQDHENVVDEEEQGEFVSVNPRARAQN
jgi:hypothetical protein